jgi:hypothetical protein
LDDDGAVVCQDIIIESLHASLADFIFDGERGGKFFIDIGNCYADIATGSWDFFMHWNDHKGHRLPYVSALIQT